MIDAFGYLFYAFLMLGTYLIGQRYPGGWQLRFIGDIGWALLGFWMGVSSIVVFGILFSILDVKGYVAWKRGQVA